MFNYFKKKQFVLYIMTILKCRDGMSIFPHLNFKYTLKDNILTLILPSKDSYMFSPFPEELTIIYNNHTHKVTLSTDDYDIMSSGSGRALLRHLKKCFSDLQERNKFIDRVVSDRKRMAKLIDPRHRHNSSGKKDGSVYRDFVYAASDDSSDDSGGSSHDHHNGHNDN